MEAQPGGHKPPAEALGLFKCRSKRWTIGCSSAAISAKKFFRSHPWLQYRSVRNYSKVRPVTFMDGYC
jgi:hypothetical protein